MYIGLKSFLFIVPLNAKPLVHARGCVLPHVAYGWFSLHQSKVCETLFLSQTEPDLFGFLCLQPIEKPSDCRTRQGYLSSPLKTALFGEPKRSDQDRKSPNVMALGPFGASPMASMYGLEP